MFWCSAPVLVSSETEACFSWDFCDAESAMVLAGDAMSESKGQRGNACEGQGWRAEGSEAIRREMSRDEKMQTTKGAERDEQGESAEQDAIRHPRKISSQRTPRSPKLGARAFFLLQAEDPPSAHQHARMIQWLVSKNLVDLQKLISAVVSCKRTSQDAQNGQLADGKHR